MRDRGIAITKDRHQLIIEPRAVVLRQMFKDQVKVLVPAQQDISVRLGLLVAHRIHCAVQRIAQRPKPPHRHTVIEIGVGKAVNRLPLRTKCIDIRGGIGVQLCDQQIKHPLQQPV